MTACGLSFSAAEQSERHRTQRDAVFAAAFSLRRIHRRNIWRRATARELGYVRRASTSIPNDAVCEIMRFRMRSAEAA